MHCGAKAQPHPDGVKEAFSGVDRHSGIRLGKRRGFQKGRRGGVEGDF